MKQTVQYEAFHDKQNDLCIFRSANAATLPHFHRCIEMLYITQGTLIGKVDDTDVVAEKDEILFVRRCAVHSIQPTPLYSDIVLIVKSAYADDFSSRLEKRSFPPVLKDKAFNRSLLPYLNKLESLQAPQDFLIAKGYIDILVGSLLAHYPREPVTPTPNLSAVVTALNYIDEHFAEPLSLDSISDAIGYNKYYFSRLFNAYIGESLNNYVNMVRVRNLLETAKRTEKPNLSTLVYDCGFDSMTTFYRHFARFYDRTPAEIIGKKQ